MAPGGAREIVDSTEIVATLENDCLLGGVSTAIVARHKMGKSFLLQHLHNRWPKLAAASDALLCHITLARLRETLGADALCPIQLTSSCRHALPLLPSASRRAERAIPSDRNYRRVHIDWSALPPETLCQIGGYRTSTFRFQQSLPMRRRDWSALAAL